MKVHNVCLNGKIMKIIPKFIITVTLLIWSTDALHDKWPELLASAPVVQSIISLTKLLAKVWLSHTVFTKSIVVRKISKKL